jgi:Zn-dependent protease
MLERIPPREWRDLAIAWFAITLAFTVVFVRRMILEGKIVTFPDYLAIIFMASITVGLGFILHELAHKFTAIRYGYWAEFQRDNLMLLVAVAMAALAGVVFAAPGATMIYAAGLTREHNGRISISGPVTNLLLALPFIALTLLGTGIISFMGIMGWQVNAMLASFNMLPVGPLDGKKILAWKPGAFGLLIVAAFALF